MNRGLCRSNATPSLNNYGLKPSLLIYCHWSRHEKSFLDNLYFHTHFVIYCWLHLDIYIASLSICAFYLLVKYGNNMLHIVSQQFMKLIVFFFWTNIKLIVLILIQEWLVLQLQWKPCERFAGGRNVELWLTPMEILCYVLSCNLSWCMTVTKLVLAKDSPSLRNNSQIDCYYTSLFSLLFFPSRMCIHCYWLRLMSGAHN